MDDIDEHSLRLLLALEPKLELLIIGTGDTEVTPEFYYRIQKIAKTQNIRVEVLKTEAVSDFDSVNFDVFDAEKERYESLNLNLIYSTFRK